MQGTKKICRLSLTYTIVADGLIGGKYEYDPYLENHATFGTHRIKKKDPLILLDPSGKGAVVVKKKADDDESKTIYMSDDIRQYKSSEPWEVTLMDYDEMKGDDTLHFKLFSHTRYSGVDSIDENEAAYRERQIQSGYCSLELFDIFRYYREACEDEKLSLNQKKLTFAVTDTFYDQKIIDEKARELLKSTKNKNPTTQQVNEMMERAKPLTEKATVIFTITVMDFNEALFKKSIFAVPHLKERQLYSKLPLAGGNRSLNANTLSRGERKTSFEPLLFNAEKSWSHWLTTMDGVLQQYCDHFMSDEEHNISCLYKPCDPSVSNLQLPMYMADCGKMPVYAYWSNHDPYFREYASPGERERDMRLYGFNAKTEAYFLMMLHSALRRFGLSEEMMIKEIEQHFSPTNMRLLPTADFLRVEEAVADLGTAVGNSGDYTADYRFMSVIDNLKDKHEGSHRTLGDLRRCVRCNKELVSKKMKEVRVISLDSWDNVILNNTSSCDDCEGQDNTSTTALRSFAVGRPDLNYSWESPALRAVKKLLDHSAIYDVGALVTSAFMDTNNKRIETKLEELPLIGSETDKNAQNDGHCFGLMQSLTRTITLLEAGNVARETIAKMELANNITPGGANKIQEEAFRRRDGRRQMLVLEPTGSIEARLLSLAESYGVDTCDDVGERLFKKQKAMYCFMKTMRIKLKAIEEAEKSGIGELYVGEGLPHYVERQVPQRRTSSFYNSVVHGSSVDLMRFDPTLSQFAFCKQGRYGVRIGELIRDAPTSQLSLVCPYANYKEQWERDVVPMVESIQNQMPIMKYGRYDDQEYEEEIYSRYIAPEEMSATFAFSDKNAYGSSVASKQAEARFEALLKEVNSLDSDKTVVRLFSRVWKLNQCAKKTARLVRFLKELPGVLDHAYYVERYIPVCEPVVEILLIVNVKTSLMTANEGDK